MSAPIIVLAGVRAELAAPSPLLALALLRSDADRLVMEPAERWALGALALLECWPMTAAWPAPLRPRRWRVGERVAERGREVFDGLLAGGVPLHALLGTPAQPATDDLPAVPARPGILQAAAEWAESSITSQWEVDGAKDFCVVRAGASPGSDSGSAAGTTSPPPGGTA